MALLLVLAYMVGGAIRFNIRHFEPIENKGHGVAQDIAFLSRVVLTGAKPAPPAAASRDVLVFGRDVLACVCARDSVRMMAGHLRNNQHQKEIINKDMQNFDVTIILIHYLDT